MIFLRSLLFVTLFYLWTVVLGILVLPLLLGPRRWTMGVFRFWTRGVFALLHVT